jgi:hypothetical protein
MCFMYVRHGAFADLYRCNEECANTRESMVQIFENITHCVYICLIVFSLSLSLSLSLCKLAFIVQRMVTRIQV